MGKPKLTEVAAVVISFCALILATVQGNETVKSNKISVRPNVDVTFNAVRGSNNPHGFKIKNSGVGPAIIESVSFYVDEKKIEASSFDLWGEVFKEISLEVSKDYSEFHIVHLPEGYYLEQGQNIYLLMLLPSHTDGESQKREFNSNEWSKLNRLGIKVEYTSMHDERCSIHYAPAKDQPYDREVCS